MGVFNDYDFNANPLGFHNRTVRALASTARRIRHLGLADSIGIDYHKTGFTPYVSSAIILKNGRDFERLTRRDEETPYIFQSGERHPGKARSRRPGAGNGPLSAIANLPSSDAAACRRCSAIWSPWPTCCANISTVTHRPR